MWLLLMGKILIFNYLGYSLAQFETPLTKCPIEWDYENQYLWPAINCKKSGQSPINIVTANVEVVEESPGSELEYSPELSEPVAVNITNSDSTVSLILADIPNGKDMQISRGALPYDLIIPTTYSFLRLEFHWPSEHKIDNQNYPLEILFVFYATKYGNPSEAIRHSDGNALFSAFVEIRDEANPVFDPILAGVPAVASNLNQPIPLNNTIVISQLFPENNKTYYSYKGSVSKPYCEDIVLFLVFLTPSYMSQSQYDQLTNIRDQNGNLVVRNNRDTQATGSRVVELRDNRVCDF